ncbi:hypothetical protein E4V42_12210 [Clostridium estertheticum]|uniref:NERD domain-containing protein n=1 Tax=Clostridium estertheticum TaxID=238834 RepID=A0A5N7IPG7_9CLOT|nr:hypothetical protein [Clostridium estertheticum]MPQ32191.1 hypothetical protein [Clostridium estertheticum]MPQ62851.1 hypothetical protein [Clostridium estertheticum]
MQIERELNLKKFNFFLINEKYDELVLYLITYCEDKSSDKILNLLTCKELLINRNSNIKKKIKFIEPFKKHLVKKDIAINNYIECCDLINYEYKNLNNFIEEELNYLYKYDIKIALVSIISKIENYNHEIIRESNVIENKFYYHDNRQNCINLYQKNIEGLGILIKKILNNSSKFKKNVGFTTKEAYRTNLNRCNKKTFKLKKLIKYLNSTVNLEELTVKINDFNFKVIKNDNNIFLEYINADEYKKREIENLRCEIFDYNNMLIYEKEYIEEENSHKNLNEFKLEEVDLENIMVYDKSDNHFSIKYDMFSTEFISTLIEAHKGFIFQRNEMLRNNLIGKEIDKLITIGKEKLNITYKEAIDFYFIIEVVSLLYYKAVVHYRNKFNVQPFIPFLGSDIETFNGLIMQLYKVMWHKDLLINNLKQLIKLYTFSENEIYDLYYKPIIKFEDRIFIIPSIIEKNNFNRTFLNHMNQIKASFKEGYLLETYLKETFKENGFIVYDKDKPNLNFNLGNGKKGDIDLLMVKGKYIFCCQIKNRENPLELRDYISFDRKINNKALIQLNFANEFIRSNPKYLTEFFKITDLNVYEFIPFIITNSFYSSGFERDGVYMTNMSALNTYFNKKTICIRNSEGNITFEKKLITENIEEGFLELLKNPYFKDEKLYHKLYFPKAYYVGDKLFVLKVKTDIIKKHLEECYLKEEVKKAYGEFNL